jgi:7,8-dihydropterin-6-yl-methyl-4-(beta-D-ribofuranosyl)aminobenzene 5'-phosphate synthase
MRIVLIFIILLLTAGVFILAATVFLAAYTQRKGRAMNDKKETVPTLDVNNLTITVIYDNNPYKQALETAWGFSALITGTEKTILFDTGGDGGLLLRNMEKLEIAADSIDTVVLSHIHSDHTGGLRTFLQNNPQVTVYLPKSFPKGFKDDIRRYGAKVIEVEQSLKICEDVYSTGQIGIWIKEQSLIVRTDKGLVIITGCAHPGIVKTVNTAKELLKDDILLVMGGFHLEWASVGKIEKIISAFKQLNVRCVGPCHCSGDKARTLFQKHFGENYISIGAGKVITVADLQ